MSQSLKKHLWYYATTVLIEGLGLVLVLLARGEKQLQLSFVVLMGFFYVIWGVAHHIIHHNLYAKVVLEYVLIASLGIALMYFVLL